MFSIHDLKSEYLLTYKIYLIAHGLSIIARCYERVEDVLIEPTERYLVWNPKLSFVCLQEPSVIRVDTLLLVVSVVRCVHSSKVFLADFLVINPVNIIPSFSVSAI